MSDVHFCHNCGRGLIEGAKFCPYCGTSINEETDAVESSAIFERYDKHEQDIENMAKWEGNVPQSTSYKTRFRCLICGYVYDRDNHPQECPVCHALADKFIPVDEDLHPLISNTKYRCLVCGYVHEGKTAPNACPVCGATTDKFMVDGAKVKAQFINCFNCMAYIPGDSKFCPVCRTELYSTCPKCGHNYSAQYLNCPQCGTNREEYLSQIKAQKEEEDRQKLRQAEALKQAALEKERLEKERLLKEKEKREELRAEQLEWLESYVKNNYQDIVQYGESLVADNKNTIQGRQVMKAVSVILCVLAILSFLFFPCFSGTEYQDLAIIGFFVVFPILGLLAILFYNLSNKTFLPDVRDGIRQMIERRYNGTLSQIGWVDIYPILKKYGVSVSPNEIHFRGN